MADNFDYYTGFTQEEVEEILSTHKGELKETMQRFSESGSSVDRLRVDEIHKIIGACQDALKKFDPDTYGGDPRRRRTGVSSVQGYLHK